MLRVRLLADWAHAGLPLEGDRTNPGANAKPEIGLTGAPSR